MRPAPVAASCLWAALAAPAAAQGFVHFESPHSHPIELSPDGLRLLVVNTPAGRLEVFDLPPSGLPLHVASVAVGVEPVAVRLRTPTEAIIR